MNHYENIQHSAGYIQEKLGKVQQGCVGLVTGTGLGALTDSVEDARSLAYKDIPGFPVSTVPSHAGALVSGRIGQTPVMVLSGRFHLYEGFSGNEAAYGVRVLGQLGVKTLILTNAAGALNPSFETGAPMLIEDHVNFTGVTPLRGDNVDAWGDRFPDMRAVYSPALRKLAVEKSLALGVRMERGVYVQVMGPNMETPAETRMYRALGGDAVGMSTCVEAVAAHHMGIRILGISCLTNKNLPDCMEEASLDEVIAQANASSATMARLVKAILKDVNQLADETP